MGLMNGETVKIAETHSGPFKNKWWIVECLRCNSMFEVAGCEFFHKKCGKCKK